jgi:hypothetical protein
MEEQDNFRRWQFLFENPAMKAPGYFPSEEEVPELADLRDEHARLLAIVEQTRLDAYVLREQREQEEEARRAAQESEFLGKGKAKELPPITVTDDAITDARVRSEAAQDALQRFAREVVGQVRERQADLLAGLESIAEAAQSKREEAQALLAEAERMVLGTKRLKEWLERASGRSALGHIAWSALPAPVAIRQPTLEELHAAQSPPVGDVIELSPAFGTDDPDDLDPDDAATRPWEVAIHD